MFTDKIHFSYFSTAYNTLNGNLVTLEMVLKLIENQNKSENKTIIQYRLTGDDELKKSLPLFLVQTTCLSSLTDAIAKSGRLTGFMLIDLDHIPPEKVSTVREHLESNPYVVFVFLSPSGTGLKVCYYTDITDPKLYVPAYLYMLKYLEKDRVFGKYLDWTVYNLNRGCYLSYDENVHRNQNPLQWKIMDQLPLEAILPSHDNDLAVPSNPLESSVLLNRIYDFYVKSKKSPFNTHKTWRDHGYMLFNYFNERDDLAEYFFRKFSMLSEKFDEKQFNKTVKSIRNRNEKNHSTISLLIKTAFEDGFKITYEMKDIDISAFYAEDRKVFINQKALQINDYISEIQLDNEKNLIIISPTNSGKTRYFFDKLEGKRILLVPMKINVDELVEKYSEPDRPVLGIQEGVNVDPSYEIMVCTYDAITKLNSYLNVEEYQLWVDEYHHFYSSGDKNFRNRVLNTIYSSMFSYKRVVLMTGTDLDDDFLFTTKPDPTKPDWYNDKYTFTKLFFEKKNVKVKPLTLVDTNDNYSSIIERLSHDGLNIIFFNDKERGARFGDEIAKNGYDVQLVNADNKSSEEVQRILRTGKVGEQVQALIVTSILQEGVSLYDKNVRGVHFIGHPTHFEIEQLVNRFRDANPQVFLYLKKGKIYYHNHLDRKYFLKSKIDEAQRQCDYYTMEKIFRGESLQIDDVVNNHSHMSRIIRDSAESLVMEHFGELEVDKIAVAHALYEKIRLYQHKDILQLLFNLVPYNYTFNWEPDKPSGEKIVLRRKRLSIPKMKEYYERVNSEGFHPYNGKNSSDEQFRQFYKRWTYISDHLSDTDVWDALEVYGRSEKDFNGFKNRIESQIFYASKGYINGKPFRLQQVADTGTIKRFYREFELDETYTAEEVLDKVIDIKMASNSMTSVKLSKNKSTRWLKEMFEIDRKKSNGKYFYTIKSLNVSGFPLDNDKRDRWHKRR